jgi:hypothetical protein
MKRMNYEWKTITPYNIRVQRRNPVTSQPVRMALQLYQVDQKSYLLDFKSLVDSGACDSRRDSVPSRSHSVSSQDSAFFRRRLDSSGSSCDRAMTHRISIDEDSLMEPLPGSPVREPFNDFQGVKVRSHSVCTTPISGLMIPPNFSESLNPTPTSGPPQHQTMEFFEMCSELIAALARQ